VLCQSSLRSSRSKSLGFLIWVSAKLALLYAYIPEPPAGTTEDAYPGGAVFGKLSATAIG
jgi:hypothetical protein